MSMIKKITDTVTQDAAAVRIRTAVWGIFALVWWGLLYPEMYFTEATCQPVILENGQEIPAELEDCREILYADNNQIIIGSRFLEWWKEKKESYLSKTGVKDE